jgi:hypothetical protein
VTQPVHHFTLMEFDGDRIDLSAIDITGRVIDRYTLTKAPTPPDQLCAYEIEELREFLRKALVAATPIEVTGDQPTNIDRLLEVPTRFAVPVAGVLRWQETVGWRLREKETPFTLQPGEPLRLPLQAVVEPRGLGASPQLTIEFAPGRFRNRVVTVSPFKLTNRGQVQVAHVSGVRVDGELVEAAWQAAQPLELLPPPGPGAPPASLDQVRLASDGHLLFIAAQLADPSRKVKVPPAGGKEPSRLVLSGEHVRVELSDGQHTHVFAISAEQIPFHLADGKENALSWSAAAAGGDGCWTAELAIPLDLFPKRENLRINIIHRGEQNREFELRPTFARGDNPDLIPHWKSATAHDQFARLIW